jgi:hypothetical protein
MAKWYVIRGGQERGPFDDEQLKEFAANGKLRSEDQIRRDGSDTTRMAKDIKGLLTSRVVPPPLPVTSQTKTSHPISTIAPLPTPLLHQRPSVILFFLICMPPVGLYLIWTHPQWTNVEKWRWAKRIWVCPVVIFSIAIAVAILRPVVDPEGWKVSQQHLRQAVPAR